MRSVGAVDAAAAADAIERDLRAVGTPERAEGERPYLKSEVEHVGATVPEIRKAAKGFSNGHPDLTRRELVAVVEALWSRPIHERRMAAVELLAAHQALLDAADLDLVERLIRGSGTWALVDGLAIGVAGRLLDRDPDVAARLDSWAGDEDLWVRRAALIAWLVPVRGGAPLGRFGDYADAMLAEREFLIRKAIGWVLREAGKRRPDEVFDWLAPRTGRASGVTVREAVKYLPEAGREELIAACRERRAAR
ncbi:MAG TPA: DNA alkylation repair protein [Solirubrobacterales bacterium]|nr:DNA alkylation repair protein [Solirubrobacterales bacterium]